MKKNLKQILAVLLGAALLCNCLTSCGSTESDIPARPPADYRPQSAPYITDKTDTDVDAADTDIDADETGDTGVEPSMEISDTDEPQEPEKPMSEPESVAELGSLIGNWSEEGMSDIRYRLGYQLEMDKAENPYGLVWHYGPAEDDPDFDRLDCLYDSYADACDWSLVFDVEFYKKAFPMLALQYDNDDALLEQHFQTVGVHEGRQGSEAFNLTAYMENCDDTVRNAFGDDYECYYFYYMLNQDSENTVNTQNTNGAYPLWLTVEMTRYQYREFNAVNEYRAEVGAASVTADPELMAFASWRAWYDVQNELREHDWLNSNPDTADEYLEDMGLWYYSENTVKSYGENPYGYTGIGQTAVRYYKSPKHYEAMVRSDNLYFGCSDIYFSAGHAMLAQFDLFAREASRSPYVYQ